MTLPACGLLLLLQPLVLSNQACALLLTCAGAELHISAISGGSPTPVEVGLLATNGSGSSLSPASSAAPLSPGRWLAAEQARLLMYLLSSVRLLGRPLPALPVELPVDIPPRLPPDPGRRRRRDSRLWVPLWVPPRPALPMLLWETSAGHKLHRRPTHPQTNQLSIRSDRSRAVVPRYQPCRGTAGSRSG